MRASASHPSSTVPRWKYDVFLSFRGEDTRKGIISHLYYELQKTECIKTFVDDQGLQVGAAISPSLLRAIEESRFGIVVFSTNYASSSWCLDELTHIIWCMEGKDRILPLFYDVEPTHVRNQTGSFGEAFTKHEEKSRHSQEKVKQWRVALRKVANLSGWDSRNFRSDRELVKHIVEFVRSKVHETTHREELERKPLSVGPYGSSKLGGTWFDDGASYSAVKQLVIGYKCFHIFSIQIEYDLDGKSFWSDKHGNDPSPTDVVELKTITLDYPDEFLTSIHGAYIDSWYFPTFIVSLTFHSNKRIYGPFGDEAPERAGGTRFSIEAPESKIVGLFGRSSSLLNLRALGAYLKPISKHSQCHRSLPGTS